MDKPFKIYAYLDDSPTEDDQLTDELPVVASYDTAAEAVAYLDGVRLFFEERDGSQGYVGMAGPGDAPPTFADTDYADFWDTEDEDEDEDPWPIDPK